MRRKPSAAVWRWIGVCCALSAVGNRTRATTCGASSSAPPSVPPFARALRVRLGIDTERQLERKIGRGEVCTGGHSNSGRVWWFSNGLQLAADGFDLRKNQYILDTLVFSRWSGRLDSTRELVRLGFGPWGALRLGMTRQDCLNALPPEMRHPLTSKAGLTWRRKVTGSREGTPGKFLYETFVSFERERLDYLRLEGYLVDP